MDALTIATYNITPIAATWANIMTGVPGITNLFCNHCKDMLHATKVCILTGEENFGNLSLVMRQKSVEYKAIVMNNASTAVQLLSDS